MTSCLTCATVIPFAEPLHSASLRQKYARDQTSQMDDMVNSRVATPYSHPKEEMGTRLLGTSLNI